MFHQAQDYFLLSLDEQDGSISNQSLKTLPYGLAGAILWELDHMGKIDVSHPERVQLIETSRTGDKALDCVLSMIEQNHFLSLEQWIIRLSLDKNQTIKRVEGCLFESGLIQPLKRRLGWPSVQPYYPLVDTLAPAWIHMKVRKVLLGNRPANAKVINLIGLIAACGLSSQVLEGFESRKARGRLIELAGQDRVSTAVNLVIHQENGLFHLDQNVIRPIEQNAITKRSTL